MFKRSGGSHDHPATGWSMNSLLVLMVLVSGITSLIAFYMITPSASNPYSFSSHGSNTPASIFVNVNHTCNCQTNGQPSAVSSSSTPSTTTVSTHVTPLAVAPTSTPTASVSTSTACTILNPYEKTARRHTPDMIRDFLGPNQKWREYDAALFPITMLSEKDPNSPLKNEPYAIQGEVHSQYRQDFYVAMVLGLKKYGYFVELGMNDGVSLSNTFRLERDFEWTGLGIEPTKKFFACQARRRCNLEHAVVSEHDNEYVSFVEGVDLGQSLTSGMAQQVDRSRVGGNAETWLRKTYSLATLLRKNNAPLVMDYLSLDTEGSEYLILKSFPFDEFAFRVITVEHNRNEAKRQNIYDILTKNGYERTLKDVAEDDFYVHKEILNSPTNPRIRQIATTWNALDYKNTPY